MLVRPCWTVRLKGGSGALGRVGGGQEPPPPKKIPGSATNAMPTILNATRRPDMKPHTRMRHPDVPSLPMQRLLEDGGRKISEMAGEPGRCTLGRSEEPYGETERSICCAICYSTQASPRKPQGSATVSRACVAIHSKFFCISYNNKMDLRANLTRFKVKTRGLRAEDNCCCCAEDNSVAIQRRGGSTYRGGAKEIAERRSR